MSITRLWVDDRRAPPETGWLWVMTASKAIDVFQAMNTITALSLDYTLDSRDWDNNGAVVLEWLRDHPEKWPTEEIRVHSSSASARGLMEHLARDYAPQGWAGMITDTGGL